MAVTIYAVERPEVTPFSMPDRFRHEIAYFMSAPDAQGVPQLAAHEYWIPLDESRRWLDDGVFRILSPLDAQNQTEVEISEEQEAWLGWMVEHSLQHVRLQ